MGDTDAGVRWLLADARGIDGRHEIGALDAVLRARRLHVERGDAQVAIVEQCVADEILQLGIGKEFLPADFGRRRAAGGRGLDVLVVRGHRRRRLLVARRHACRRDR